MDFKVYGYLRMNETEFAERTLYMKLEAFLRSNNLMIEDVISEFVSGSVKARNREKLPFLVHELRKNDVLVVVRLLDLGRYYADTLETVSFLNQKGVRLCILDIEGFNNWFFVINDNLYQVMVKILLDMLTLLVVQEKRIQALNTKIGMYKSEEKGKKPGRPKVEIPRSYITKYKSFRNGYYGGMSINDFCKMVGISRSLYYKYKKILEKDGEM